MFGCASGAGIDGKVAGSFEGGGTKSVGCGVGSGVGSGVGGEVGQIVET